MFSSIKAKIIIFYMAVLLLTLSVLGALLYFSLSKIVYDSIDSNLLSKATALATLIGMDAGDKTPFKFSDEIIWEYNSPNARSFFQIRRLDGKTIEKSASLGNRDLPFSTLDRQTSFEFITLGRRPARLINFHIPGGNGELNVSENKKDSLVIQCAEDIRFQVNLIKRYRIALFLSILSIVIVSASGGLLIAHRALTPIKNISETIDKISESNLSERMSVEEIPQELRILASSFNRTFDRLEMAFIRQKQFAADASHELRTPLSVILSQSEIILRKDRTAGEYRNSLATIKEAAIIMSEIVRKLLAIAQLSADNVGLRFESVSLSEIISESVKLLSPLAEHRGVSIYISPLKPLAVLGDRSLLSELVNNLIGNAIKYNVPHGKIYIDLTKEPELIVIKIRDTGIGIPEGDLAKVFDRFYRVDKSRSRESGGSGLGLSICNEIVKLHNGRIEIKSKVDEGSTVSVYLKEDRDDISGQQSAS
ncbi:MAG TPA: ATP-binding protein [Dissulfurispiraceae bacterium]|nr:ATP-binding protein [Dissulfurispiraceae bacterium]